MGIVLYHLKVSDRRVKDRYGNYWDFRWRELKDIFTPNFKNSLHSKVYHYYDWESVSKNLGIDVTGCSEFRWESSSYDSDNNKVFHFRSIIHPDSVIEVNEKDVPIKKVREKVIYFEMIALNSGGVDPGVYDGFSYPILTTKDEVTKLRTYIDRGLEYFDENFINNFTEGESLIYISW